MRLQRLDNLTIAGLVLGLIGSLLALVPYLERLLLFSAGWQEPLVMGTVATAGVAGVVLASREQQAVGGITLLVAGVLLAVLGPTAPGVLAVLGGTLLYASTQSSGPSAFQEESETDQPTSQG